MNSTTLPVPHTSATPTIEPKGIEQTRQLLRAALRVGIRVKKATADGRISIAEYAAFTADVGIILDALRGIGEVPKELLDMSRPETNELQAEAVAVLAELGVTTRQEELIAKAFSAIQANVDFLAFIVLAPPSAIAVE